MPKATVLAPRVAPLSERPALAVAVPMLVAVEATRLRREVRGIGRYVRALLPRLTKARPGLRLALFAVGGDDCAYLTDWLADDPVLRGRAEVRDVRHMRSAQADLFWYPWNVAVPAPRHGPVVVTMHDVAPVALADPRWSAWYKNLRWRRRYAATARRADMIVADSSFTASEIHRVLSVPRDRIRVALLAADSLALERPADELATLLRLGVRPPFVLSVGAGDRRKNLGVLARAMERVVTEHPELTLVQAGPRKKSRRGTAEQPWVRNVGFVTDNELAALYRAATALVMASTYEGFGLPVLEAMRCGTPVICARASSLPEVAGDAALWVAPNDAGELERAIAEVFANPGTRRRMAAAGLNQASRFSWEETALKTLAAFDDARLIVGSTRPR